MDLMEYKARELFEAAGLPVKKGVNGASVDELAGAVEASDVSFPLVIKAQVQVGGRGKAGGIKMADDMAQLKQMAGEILGMNIKGHIVKHLMAVEKADVSSEMYISIMLDRLSKSPLIIFSPCGGMDIEETSRTNPEKIFKIVVPPLKGITKEITSDLAAKAGLSGKTGEQFEETVVKLYNFFRASDCMLAEINPLAVDGEGNIVALDGKVSVDDSALYRQPVVAEFKQSLLTEEKPIVLEAAAINLLYVPCEEDGNIAVASNGSGMLMSCIDRISAKGMKVRAGVDLGGGATNEKIKNAIRVILSDEKTEALFINEFGGITRCDEVALGLVNAKKEFGINKFIVIRFEGTNKDEGIKLAQGLDNVVIVDGLVEGVEALYKWRNEK